MAKKYENIENIGKLISGGAVAELSKKISGAEKAASDILKKLNEIETAIRNKRYEEEQAAIQAEAAKLAAQSAPAQPAEVKSEPAEAVVSPVTEAEPVVEVAETPASKPEVTEQPSAKPAPAQPVAEQQFAQSAQTAQPAQPAEKPRPSYIRGHVSPVEQRPARPENKTFINSDNRPQRRDNRGQRPAGQT